MKINLCYECSVEECKQVTVMYYFIRNKYMHCVLCIVCLLYIGWLLFIVSCLLGVVYCVLFIRYYVLFVRRYYVLFIPYCLLCIVYM
jgi:hypothetical protein